MTSGKCEIVDKKLNYFVFINIGPIGLVSLLAAKAMGASQVIISGNVYMYKRELYMYKLHI